MEKNKFSFWVWLFVEWLVAVGLVRWLAGRSWWLALFLGYAMANVAELYRRIRWNRHLFDIADAELVRVSALASSLEEDVADLRSQLAAAKDRVDELQSTATRQE